MLQWIKNRLKRKHSQEIGLESFLVLSPEDKRDYIAPEPPQKVRRSFQTRRPLQILDQGKTSHCTSFALLSMFFHQSSSFNKLVKYYGNDLAHDLAFRQIENAKKYSGKVRSAITNTGGYNLRAALWNLSKGFYYGDLGLKIDKYYRVPITDWQSLTKYIHSYGGVYVGIVYADGEVTQRGFKRNGKKRNRGHAVYINGYSVEEKCFYVVNSWGTRWGINGIGKLSFSDFPLVKEGWVVSSSDMKVNA